MENLVDLARRLRPLIVKSAQSLSDDDAAGAACLYDPMRFTGDLIKAGTRINWHGTVKRAAVDLWDREDSTPEAAPDLWEDLVISGGYREIPETITPGLAFGLGEKGWWKGELYESQLESNVWTPDQNAAGWKKVQE